MAYLTLCLLIFVHLLPWLFFRNTPLFFSPEKICALLSALHAIPHYVIVIVDPKLSIIYEAVQVEFDDLLVKFGLYYSLGFFSFLAALYLGKQYFFRGVASIKTNQLYEENSLKPAIFCLCAYILATFLIFEHAGGFFHFLYNIDRKDELKAGSGIYLIIKTPAAYLAVLLFLNNHVKHGKPGLPVLLLILLGVVSLEATFGGRRAPIQFIIFFGIALSILKSDYKLFKLRNVIFMSFVALIFVGLLYIRDIGGFNRNESDRGFLDYVVNFSYNDVYMYVLYHFGKNDFWYGSIYLDLFYRFLPFYSDVKPPIDEGMYIYNLFLGYDVAPPFAQDRMAHNSWPPRTFGNGYLNFGLVGVVALFSIKGIITAFVYKLAKYNRYSPVYMFYYLLIIFSFQVANLKLSELFIVSVGSFLLTRTIKLTRLKSNR